MIELPELTLSDYMPAFGCDPPLMPGVYFYSDENHEVIYVGKTVCLHDRHNSHVWQKDIPGAVYYQYAVLTDMADVDIYETYYINKFLPKLNKAKRFREHLIDDEEMRVRYLAKFLGVSRRTIRQAHYNDK